MNAYFVCFWLLEANCLFRFGRKKAILIYYGIKLIGIAMSTFGPNYAIFATGRFLVACSFGSYIAGYVLGKNTVRFPVRIKYRIVSYPNISKYLIQPNMSIVCVFNGILYKYLRYNIALIALCSSKLAGNCISQIIDCRTFCDRRNLLSINVYLMAYYINI